MRDDSDIAVTVVIPGYNEEHNIEGAVKRCLGALQKLGLSHELIIINDASTDRTGEIADSLARANQAVRVIHNPINLNVGISVLIGMRAARGRIVTHNSMDLPFDPDDLARLLPMMERADIVVVVRKDRSAHSAWRKLTSLAHHWMVRLLFMTDIRDMNFVQAYRREVVQGLDVKAKSPAFVTPELLIRAQRRRLQIVEMAADFHRRRAGSSSFGRPRDILWTFSDMLSFWLEGRGRSR